MDKSIVFFDIDGTIWDYKNDIPASTIEGIRSLKEQGHYAFICSGRTKSTIRNPKLLALGFDGMIAGCGTYIEYQEEVFVNELLPWSEIQRLVPLMKQRGIGAFLEGCDKLYIDWSYYTGSAYAEGFLQELQSDCLPIEEANRHSRINKISIEYLDIPHDEIRALYQDQYSTIIHDFTNPDGSPLNVAEIIPKGYSKATGIQWVCNHLGIDRENTYAFGDSANDIEMLQYVKHGIAMGDASRITKQAADFVTTPMYEDGIWNGLKHYQLVQD